ncbi:MAG: S-adenosylmethionine:tRNA ribosyltransferase-isomerase, partial [Chloroflexota bacterium]|nr:S-adenosylmethionine:tRNA ribosyltransferase-isomerase [Chloroflexota bacterium]
MSDQRNEQPHIRMADYDYELPGELIAQVPLEDRTASRLMVLDRTSGTITHSRFACLTDFLQPGDLLVFNDSRVITARLRIRRETGGVGELLLLRRDDSTGVWTALARPARRLRTGERVSVERLGEAAGPAGDAEVVGRDDSGLTQMRLG